MQRVLVTGAAGAVGTMLRPRLARTDRVLRLLDVAPLTALEREEAITASVNDLDTMRAACRDVDAIVHLAGHAERGDWPTILERNIEGTHTMFEACRLEGVPRVVFASSNHAVGFYPRSSAPAPDDAFPAPDSYYGVSKVVGEALGSMYHHRHGIDVVCLRILTCRDRPVDLRGLSTWLSPDDAGRLVDAALTVPSPGFRVVWGVSANTRGWVSLDGGRTIGYEPLDDAEVYAEALIAEHGEPDLDALEHRYLGGSWTC